MNRPLTKERVVQIGEWLDGKPVLTDYLVYDLLAAEAYWREAVKDSDPVEYYGVNDDRRCYWCARDFYGDVGQAECKDPEKHEPDCPWVLAQEPS